MMPIRAVVVVLVLLLAILSALVLERSWRVHAGLAPLVPASTAPLAQASPPLPRCAGNSRMDGGRCTCPTGTRWTGSMCMQVWSSASGSVVMQPVSRADNVDNSVIFARHRVPSLPYNLGTWQGKVKAINSVTPRPGSVAMIEISSGKYKPAGHVAIVEAVTDTSLTIIEGNYLMGTVTRRTASGKDVDDAARQLNIVGYYKP